MKILQLLSEEKAQTGIEVLIALGLAVMAAVTIGLYVKSVVTEKAQPEIQGRT